MTASASRTGASGGSVTGSTIMPDSERLTLSTSLTCSSIDRLRWTMPRPPSRARAIAIRASVTVSMAAERTGMAREIDFVSRVAVLAVAGSTVGLGGNEQHVVEGQTETDEFLRVGERVERVQLCRPTAPRCRYRKQ